MPEPQIALIGAGAVGTLLASALLHNKIPFYWVEKSDLRRSQLINLNVVIGHRSVSVQHEMITVLPEMDRLAGELELVIVAVKSYHVEAVTERLRGRARRILVVANGLLQGGFHIGLLYGGGSIQESGVTHLMQDNELIVGPLSVSGDEGCEIASRLNTPWLSVIHDTDIRIRMFHKLALNCVINPLSAIMDKLNGDIISTDTESLMRDLLAEINLVARETIGITWQHSESSLMVDCKALIKRTAENSSSMREDVRRGNRTEISKMNLAIAELGAGLGLDCPCNKYMGNMICLLTNRQAL